jgi:hypothetical protein
MSKSIEWNPQAYRYLTPMHRDAYERGEEPRKLDGKLSTDAAGNVWYVAGEHRKIVGATAAPAVETRASGELDVAHAPSEAPPAKSRKVARKKPKVKRAK